MLLHKEFKRVLQQLIVCSYRPVNFIVRGTREGGKRQRCANIAGHIQFYLDTEINRLSLGGDNYIDTMQSRGSV